MIRGHAAIARNSGFRRPKPLESPFACQNRATSTKIAAKRQRKVPEGPADLGESSPRTPSAERSRGCGPPPASGSACRSRPRLGSKTFGRAPCRRRGRRSARQARCACAAAPCPSAARIAASCRSTPPAMSPACPSIAGRADARARECRCAARVLPPRPASASCCSPCRRRSPRSRRLALSLPAGRPARR